MRKIKIIAGFLLFIYFFGTTEAYQFLKFPLLITHYLYHADENPDFSVSDFIKVHYLDEQVNDKDYLLDMQLPFKSHDTDILANAANFTLIPQKIEINIPHPVVAERKYILLNDTNIPLTTLNEIFQPPKA